MCIWAMSGTFGAPSPPPPPPPHTLSPLVQGSTWMVRRRNYYTHDPHPPTLAAQVSPADVPYLRPAARCAVWSDKLQVGGFQ